MKYDVTQEDKDIMTRDMLTDKTLKHIRNLSFYKFSVGDVLIRQERRYVDHDKYEWKTYTANCDLPYKYVYVFENDLGVGYIRRLSVNGQKFVERPICVTEFDPDSTQFIVDPEYADHMMLAEEGEEFDTKSRYAEKKRKREQTHRKNKKIAIPLPDETAALEWMKTLKVGDQFWYGHSIGYLNKDPVYVHEVNLVEPPKVAGAPTYNPYYGYHAQFQPNIKVGPQPLAANTTANPYASTLYANSIPRYYVFTQRPFFAEEVIN